MLLSCHRLTGNSEMSGDIPDSEKRCYQSQSNISPGAQREPMMNAMPILVSETDCLLQQPLRAHSYQQVHPHQQAAMHVLQHATSVPNQQHPNVYEHCLGKTSMGSRSASTLRCNEREIGVTDDHTDDLDDSDDHTDGKERQDAAWQRVKWTDDMVRLLIHIVHAVGEDGFVDNLAVGNKRKASILQKKGKWRLVSNMMNDRKCCVSPQQCEDKFNDLNKRYKRLNDILGKNIAVQVVKCPDLIDRMSNISSKTKEDIKKIISSKHTFYDEMHSFYNGYAFHESCSSQFQPPVSQPAGLGEQGNANIEDRKPITQVEQNVIGIIGERTNLGKHMDGSDNAINGLSMTPNSLLDDSNLSKNILASQILQLQQEKFSLQTHTFELEKEYIRWQKLCAEKDGELVKLREENKRMKAENDNLILLLKQGERKYMYRSSE